MREFIRTYLSSTAIFFMVIVLVSTGINFISGFENTNNLFFPEVFIYLLVCDLVDYILSEFSFQKSWQYHLAHVSVIYILFLIFSFFCSWFLFSLRGVLQGTVIFGCIYFMVKHYYTVMETAEAAEINSMLISRPADDNDA